MRLLITTIALAVARLPEVISSWRFIIAYLSAKHDPLCSNFLIASFPISVCHPA